MLTKKIANDIVLETSVRLHRNVNIMDIDGIIIAAIDTSRIGLIHEGAIEVLQSGNTLSIHPEEEKDWKVAQPGLNLPIVFQNETIGVIGITGNPDEMKDIGELVKMTTELMIKQEFIASQLEWKQRIKDMIVGELLKTSPSYSDIHRSLDLLQFDFQPPFLTIMLQIEARNISNHAFIQMIEEVIGKDKSIMSFTKVNRLVLTICGLAETDALQRVNRLYQRLQMTNIQFRMSYSLPFYEVKKFHQSYVDCELTLKISDKQKKLVSFSNIEVKSLIYQLNTTLAERFSNRVFQGINNEVTSKTLKSFFENHLNIQKAADALFVHRNTLIYRFNKITEETGYDPRNFEDALNLQVALWISEKLEGIQDT